MSGKGKPFEEAILLRAEKLAERNILTLRRYGVQACYMKGESGKLELKAIQSYPDFDGAIAPYGRELIIEAKTCGDSSYALKSRGADNPKQINHMIERARFGSLCYLMVHFTKRVLVTKTDEQFTVAFRVHPEELLWREFFNCGRLTIGREEAKVFGIMVPWNLYSSRASKLSPDLTCLLPEEPAPYETQQEAFSLSSK
jgi:hypothetical protein